MSGVWQSFILPRPQSLLLLLEEFQWLLTLPSVDRNSCFLIVLRSWSMLIARVQDWLTVNPVSILKLSEWSHISVSSNCSQYCGILRVYTVSSFGTVTSHCWHAWLKQAYMSCGAFHLVSVGQHVCQACMLPHTQGMQYVPETFRPGSCFAGFSRCAFLWAGMHRVLVLNLVRSLLILS